MSDFAGLDAEGDWTLRILDRELFGEEGTLNAWCIDGFTDCITPFPTGLECNRIGSTVELDWETGNYDSVIILRDGEELAELDGGEEAYIDEDPSFRALRDTPLSGLA